MHMSTYQPPREEYLRPGPSSTLAPPSSSYLPPSHSAKPSYKEIATLHKGTPHSHLPHMSTTYAPPTKSPSMSTTYAPPSRGCFTKMCINYSELLALSSFKFFDFCDTIGSDYLPPASPKPPHYMTHISPPEKLYEAPDHMKHITPPEKL